MAGLLVSKLYKNGGFQLDCLQCGRFANMYGTLHAIWDANQKAKDL